MFTFGRHSKSQRTTIISLNDVFDDVIWPTYHLHSTIRSILILAANRKLNKNGIFIKRKPFNCIGYSFNRFNNTSFTNCVLHFSTISLQKGLQMVYHDWIMHCIPWLCSHSKYTIKEWRGNPVKELIYNVLRHLYYSKLIALQ